MYEPKLTDESLDKYRMLSRLQWAVACGLIFILFYALQLVRSLAFFTILSVGIVIGGAFLLVGFLLGFIFAIPRTPKQEGAAAAASSDSADGSHQTGLPQRHSRAIAFSAVEPNTNLVDISDWLTKILVGVGLVELRTMHTKIAALASFLGRGLRICDSNACIQSSEIFALAIVLFFFGAGFLIGYLWTRLYFQRALADLADRAHRVERSWENATVAELLMKDGRLKEAIELIDAALINDRSNALALFTKARILKRLALASGDPSDKALLKEALEYAQQAADLLPNSAGTLYNIACYQALLGVDRTEVFRNLKQAVQMNPTLKEEASKDEDFKTFWEDADFKEFTKS